MAEKKSKLKYRQASDPVSRENQMISLAMDNAEQRLRDGTASSQLVCHFLKLATTKAQLEKEKLANENFLLQTKTKAIEDDRENDLDYQKVYQALKGYRGEVDYEEGDDNA